MLEVMRSAPELPPAVYFHSFGGKVVALTLAVALPHCGQTRCCGTVVLQCVLLGCCRRLNRRARVLEGPCRRRPRDRPGGWCRRSNKVFDHSGTVVKQGQMRYCGQAGLAAKGQASRLV